ncbi:formate dehydrogenase O subunit beta [Klebsiella pneumoniae]|uniref:Formate dehydrogenase O subunit beta n=1 Tax=Klebsiella pneumoniae TaxID=573 RepID=A0A3S4KF01_KLEPN|nr:formate dehydrogenase O subunit beta [Klebsiella pneumoniae]
MAYQSQDIIRRSATNGFTPAPQARDHQQEVAKLIDVTTCNRLQSLSGGLLRMERYS